MRDETRIKILRYLSEKEDWLNPHISANSAYGYCYAEISELMNCPSGEEIAELDFLATHQYLDTRFFDKIHLCPNCDHYNLNFREICTKCRSSDIVPTIQIHHFHCGYVAPEPEYRKGLDYICPKCHKVLRHIGIDYEEPSEPFVCNACENVFVDADVSCVCLGCDSRFEVQNAVKHDLYRYKINPHGINAVELGRLRENENQLYDPDFPVYNDVALVDHLRLFFNNSVRYGRGLALIKVKFNLSDTPTTYVGPNDTGHWLREVILKIREAVRSADLVGLIKPGTLAIVLPDTGEEAIGAVCEKIHRAIREIDRSQYSDNSKEIEISFAVYSAEMKYAEQMLDHEPGTLKVIEP